MTNTREDLHWLDNAKCRSEDPEIFFMPSKVEQAKEICSGCDVRLYCGLHADMLESQERSKGGFRVQGVWGGTARGRRYIAEAKKLQLQLRREHQLRRQELEATNMFETMLKGPKSE